MITGKKVLNVLVDSLNELSLPKMAGALQEVYRSDRYNSLDHLSFLSEIVTPEYNARMETRLNNRLSTAHLKGCPEDIAMGSDLSRIILARKNKFGSLTKEIISYYKLLCQYCYFLYLSLAYKEMPKLAKNKSISLSGTVG